jgi:hypothetical protein
MWPLAFQFWTSIVVIGYILVMRRQGHLEYTWRFLLPGNPAASNLGAVPLWILAVFSLGDQLSNILMIPPIKFLSQTMMMILGNTDILWTVLFQFIFLGTRFKQTHVIGCLQVILAVLVGLSPGIVNNNCSEEGLKQGNCLNSYKGNNGQYYLLSMGTLLFWMVMYVASILPLSAGKVFKQWVLQGREVDVMYAMWWSRSFQVLWGWLSIPTIWVSLPGQDVKPSETGTTLINTFSCMLGNVPVPGQDDTCAADSPSPMVMFCICVMFHVIFSFMRLWLIKCMSATWLNVAGVLGSDLGNILGMFPFFAGGGARIMSYTDWLGTALTSIALWVYSLKPEGKKGEEEHALGDKKGDKQASAKASEGQACDEELQV